MAINRFAVISLIAALAGVSANGQMLSDHQNFFGSTKDGFGIYGVNAFAGYSTSNTPVPSLGLKQSNVMYGASGSVGWQHRGENANASVLYTGTYGGVNADSDLNAYNQTLSLGSSWKITPKFSLSISGSGQDSTLSQYLFQPLGFSVLTSLPTSFNDLSATLGVGQFSSAQIQAVNTQAGTLYLVSPIRTGLLGDRVLSYSGNVGLNYTISRRLEAHASGFTAGGQTRYAADSNTPGQNYLIPNTLGGTAGLSFAIFRTPRTEAGVAVDEYYASNRYQESYSTTGLGYFRRKMGPSWLLSLSVGATRSNYIQQFAGTPATLQGVGSASLAYKLRTQTFIANYSISASDVYGLATGTNIIGNASWNWQRPGSRFSLFAYFERQEIRNTGYLTISGWRAGPGFNMTLTRQTYIFAQYVYLDTQSRYLGSPTAYIAHTVRVSFGWSPHHSNR
jgi:hypothetical protein